MVPYRKVSESVLRPGSTLDLVYRGIHFSIRKRSNTYVNELLQVIIEIGQVILSSLIIGNELLFALQELLALLFEGFTFSPFVVDAGHHECVFVIVLMFGLLGEKLFDGDERQLLVLVAGKC